MSWRLAFHSTKLLFSYIIPYKVKIFRDAIIAGNIGLVRRLAAERPRLLYQAIDGDGNTAIGLAIILGNVELLNTLLEIGSNPNLANVFDGNHPLVMLAKLRADENSKTLLLADILLNAGSNPLHAVRHQADTANRIDATQTPWFEETPLLCAVRFQNEELLNKFLNYGVDVNYLNPDQGTSPLMLAAALGLERICNILIEAGADINASDHSGNTPLHLATMGYGDKLNVVRTLLEHGADRNALNENGLTAAVLAKQVDNDACYKLIEEFKIKNLPEKTDEPVESNDEEQIISLI